MRNAIPRNHLNQGNNASISNRRRCGHVVYQTAGFDFGFRGPFFKSSSLSLSDFVLGGPEFISSAVLCEWPTGQPPTS